MTDFREFTPAELIRAIQHLDSDFDSVELEVQAADGTALATNVVQLNVDVGTDFDRTGGYTWIKITGRLEQ